MFKILESLARKTSDRAQDIAWTSQLYHTFQRTMDDLAGYSVKVKVVRTVPIYSPTGCPPQHIVDMLSDWLQADNYRLGPWDEEHKRFFATYITD